MAEHEGMSLTLTDDELVELTDYRRRDKQRLALAHMRIPFEVTPRGTIKVLRRHFDGGQTRAREEPDYGAI
jgi:hypothetical protein